MRDLLRTLETDELNRLLESLEPDVVEAVLQDWQGIWARDEQVIPPGYWWLIWLLLTGRGWGKTRTGGEFIKQRTFVEEANCRVALVAETFADGRDTMVEGESGLLSILPPSALRGGTVDSAWNRSMGELFLSNGTQMKVFSSEKPGKLRGPQHHYAWCDELAKFMDANLGDTDDTTWSNLMLGLRLGEHPQVVVTTTPKRVRLLVGTREKPGIMKQKTTIVTKGTTYENLPNLAPPFRQMVLERYEGTRLGRQELHAEILEDVEGAFWTALGIDKWRVPKRPVHDFEWVRFVVAVDPAVTSGEDADSTGIIMAGRAADGHAYVLEDRTVRQVSPDTWGRRVVKAFDDGLADHIVVEVNNGGELVSSLLRTIRPSIPIRAVHATRGKRLRAEPVAALYEQGLVHHVGLMPELEEEMTTWTPESGDSPDRLDALVWALTDLMLSGTAAASDSMLRDDRLRGRR